MDKTHQIVKNYESFLIELVDRIINTPDNILGPIHKFNNSIVMEMSDVLNREEFGVDYQSLESSIRQLNVKYEERLRANIDQC